MFAFPGHQRPHELQSDEGQILGFVDDRGAIDRLPMGSSQIAGCADHVGEVHDPGRAKPFVPPLAKCPCLGAHCGREGHPASGPFQIQVFLQGVHPPSLDHCGDLLAQVIACQPGPFQGRSLSHDGGEGSLEALARSLGVEPGRLAEPPADPVCQFVHMNELDSPGDGGGEPVVQVVEYRRQILHEGGEQYRWRHFPGSPAAGAGESLRQDGGPVECDHRLPGTRRPPDTGRPGEVTFHQGTLVGMEEDHPVLDRGRHQALKLLRRQQRRQTGQGAPLHDCVPEPPVPRLVAGLVGEEVARDPFVRRHLRTLDHPVQLLVGD